MEPEPELESSMVGLVTKKEKEMEQEPESKRRKISLATNSEQDDSLPSKEYPKPTIEIISAMSPKDLSSTGPCISMRDKNKRIRPALFKIVPSVVSVSTFLGDEKKIDCSGLIIEWDAIEKEATILTSAKVLKAPNNEFVGCKSNVIVRLADGRQLLGTPDYVDYYHNILTLKVKATTSLDALDLRSKQAHVFHGMDVIALGRGFFTCGLSHDTGVLFLEYPHFGCDELLRSTCRTSPVSEGGPVITDDGCIVGINFLDDYVFGHTLPTPIVISSLDMWKMRRCVERPWFGLTAVDSDQLPYDLWEQYHKSPDVSFVAVMKVYKGSPAEQIGVRAGDRIMCCDGIDLKTVKEFSQLLLKRSRCLAEGSHQSIISVGIEPFARCASYMTIEAEDVSVADKKFLCCWPSVDAQWYCKALGSKVNTWKEPIFFSPPLHLKEDI